MVILRVTQLYLTSPPLTSSLLNPAFMLLFIRLRNLCTLDWISLPFFVYYYPILMHNINSFLHTKKDFHCRGLGGWLGPYFLHGHAEWIKTRDLTLGNFDLKSLKIPHADTLLDHLKIDPSILINLPLQGCILINWNIIQPIFVSFAHQTASEVQRSRTHVAFDGW